MYLILVGRKGIIRMFFLAFSTEHSYASDLIGITTSITTHDSLFLGAITASPRDGNKLHQL